MATYAKISLDENEKAIFDDEWDKLWTRHFVARDIIDVYEDARAAIQEVAEISKAQFDGSGFGGVNAATNEFGWTPIMPNHLLATSSPTYATATWNDYITTSDVTSRWVDWIGTSSSNFRVSKYANLIIIGFVDPVDEPKIGGILAKVKAKDYPVWYFSDHYEETDYPVVQLPQPIVVEKNQEMYLQKLCIRAGLSRLRPIGVLFGTGSYLRNKNAYAET